MMAADFESAYLAPHRSGELGRRADGLWAMMDGCRLCPRQCGADRLGAGRGFCGVTGTRLVVAAAHPHFGEESPLVGSGGSGTIFLAHCSLRCDFCQNWELSITGEGSVRSIAELAEMMLGLQGQGCRNINFVTPTHYSAHIARALDLAAGRGLRLPVVWNTCGWERPEVLGLLDGLVDIYLPDFKYWDEAMAARHSCGAKGYPELTRQALLEMRRQVGPARLDADGVMLRGLIIRHLVLPGGIGGSERIMDWIAGNLPDAYVNVMAQYHPEHRALELPELNRRITRAEYKVVVDRAKERGLKNLETTGAWLVGL